MVARALLPNSCRDGFHPLTLAELLPAVTEIGRLYPVTPPLVFWRAYERAIYARLAPCLTEPVLDVGCGDGSFFSLLWPGCQEVDGVDCDPAVVVRARASGRYRRVWENYAHHSGLPVGRYGTAFSNCALEHMDEISGVVRNIHASLAPGGRFIGSMVTEKFLSWSTLPKMLEGVGDGGPAMAKHLQSAYERFHHLRNALPIAGWREVFENAGFLVEGAVPFMAEFSSRLFLFLDNLWHLGEERGVPCGPRLERYLAGFPDFPRGLPGLIEGAFRAERDFTVGSGLVIVARKAVAG